MVATDNITILYVDDEESNLFLFKISFETDYSVFTAISGEEGLKELEEHKDEIIVVVSDMRMPGMNGVEFIRRAREIHDNIIYFVLTAYEYDDEINLAIKEKVINKYFTKPFEKSKIESAILDALKSLD